MAKFSRALIGGLAACLAATAAHADGGCDDRTMTQYRDCIRLVDSLRPDKFGQARVFASDGSEFTAGQSQWMKVQLRKVARLCAHGTQAEQAEAVAVLADVQGLLQSHHRGA
jgi:hypothetical protein